MGLKISQVSHAYNGSYVVREVDLRVSPGEVACLLGPSGCGKSTLLRLVAGLEPLVHGNIMIGDRIVSDGRNGIQVPPEARRVGLMFQDYALFPHLSVRANIAFGINGRRPERKQWIEAALNRVGLSAVADRYPHTLSGGQQQRCALLRALAPQPDVLLLDEPFSGLDVTLRAQVREQTLSIIRETGVATLVVTHDPEEAMFMADKLFVMREGSIVQSGRPDEIYLSPADAFVAALFGPLNRLSGVVNGAVVNTQFGPFAVSGLDDGSAVNILIRPEAVRYAPPGMGTPAEVVSAQLLGRTSHLRLAVQGCEEPIQALLPGISLPKDGTIIRITLDSQHMFVFAGSADTVSGQKLPVS